MLNLFNNVSAVSAIKDGVPPNGMPFDKFREVFFPHLHILAEENQSDGDRAERSAQREFKENKGKQPKVLEGRILDLDNYIKEKIASNYF